MAIRNRQRGKGATACSTPLDYIIPILEHINGWRSLVDATIPRPGCGLPPGLVTELLSIARSQQNLSYGDEYSTRMTLNLYFLGRNNYNKIVINVSLCRIIS